MWLHWACCLGSALVLLAPPLGAQQRGVLPDPLFDQLVAEALTANPSLAGTAATARGAETRVRAAGALPDPTIMTGVGNLTLPNFAFRESDFTEVVVEVTQAFPWPGTLGARTREAHATAVARAAQARAAERDVVVQVAERYYGLRYVAAAQVELERQRMLLDAAAQVSLTRYAGGLVPQTDPLQARIARSRLDAERAALTARDRRLRAELAALRGVHGPEVLGIQPIEPDLVVLGGSLTNVPGDSVLARHPRVQALEAQILSSTAVIDIERRAARPDFEVTARYGARPLGADFFSAFVGFRLPLWAGRKQHRLADAAEADTLAARAALTEELLRLGAEVRALEAEAAADAERARLLVQEVIPAADATVEAALRGYRLGADGFLTVLLAQEALYRARLDAAIAAAGYLVHSVMLQQLLAPEAHP